MTIIVCSLFVEPCKELPCLSSPSNYSSRQAHSLSVQSVRRARFRGKGEPESSRRASP